MWDQLKAESDLDFKPERIARVEVAFEDSDLPDLEETLKVCESTDGFSARWMDDRELRDLEPRLSPGSSGGSIPSETRHSTVWTTRSHFQERPKDLGR